MEGVHRFLARAYRLVTGDSLTDAPPSRDQLRLLHATIKRVGCVWTPNLKLCIIIAECMMAAKAHMCLQVTEETEGLRFNTAIAAMMEFINGAYKWELVPRDAVQPFVLLLAPYAPHLAEELWQVAVICRSLSRMHIRRLARTCLQRHALLSCIAGLGSLREPGI